MTRRFFRAAALCSLAWPPLLHARLAAAAAAPHLSLKLQPRRGEAQWVASPGANNSCVCLCEVIRSTSSSELCAATGHPRKDSITSRDHATIQLNPEFPIFPHTDMCPNVSHVTHTLLPRFSGKKMDAPLLPSALVFNFFTQQLGGTSFFWCDMCPFFIICVHPQHTPCGSIFFWLATSQKKLNQYSGSNQRWARRSTSL
jgi:hypothetical protein